MPTPARPRPDDRFHADHVADHTPAAVTRRLEADTDVSYLKDFIYGAIDGAVTTFAVVSGVAGAGLSPSIIIVLGLANLIADGFSMATGNFLGTRAERQQRERARRDERRQIRLHPEGEREEIRQIFASKGFEGVALDAAVDAITTDEDRWVDTMVQEELGLPLTGPKPWKAGLVTFLAFQFVGAVPLLTYLWNWIVPSAVLEPPFLWASILTGAAFFAIGAMKSIFVGQRWLVAGLETLLIGGIAAVMAYTIGAALRGLVD